MTLPKFPIKIGNSRSVGGRVHRTAHFSSFPMLCSPSGRSGYKCANTFASASSAVKLEARSTRSENFFTVASVT